MNLTEPDAGSDLSGIRARAVPRGDGTWAVRGTKIFVTWGEHDLTENIVHMVLARTSDEPGTRGISLFVVPKFLLDPDGLPGERNRVSCLATEHKLGIHASPTCVMEYDEAVAELVGAEGEGLSAMFTMMNVARLSVGVQGLSVSERACQQADTFARERLQGRAPGAAPGERSAIIDHPDVRRMLLVIASSTAAQRLLLYTTAAERDLAGAVDAESDGVHQQRVELLTPIAKAWSTEEGVRNASLALQVHGGMGYVEETGIAQHLRDVRIAPIYEGTNGIQAIDLAVRKVSRDRGAAMGTLVAEMRETIDELGSDDELAALAGALAGAVTTLERATATLAGADEVDMLAAATSYLELAGLVIGGRLLAVHALRLRVEGSTGADRAVALARFFAVERLAEVASLAARVEAGGSHHVTL
jgi:alkylation response protein AidB-like acyl-CoA dehydrogenase